MKMQTRRVESKFTKRASGPLNIFLPEVKADSFLHQMFSEDLIDLIVNETNRNAE